MSSLLPTELKIAILDRLQGDARTLSAVSLTAHHWLLPAQSALFSHLTLQQSQVHGFAEFIRLEEHRHLAEEVVRLQLKADKAAGWDGAPLSDLIDLRVLLPNLQSLILDGVILNDENLVPGSAHPCDTVEVDNTSFLGTTFPVFVNTFAGRVLSVNHLLCPMLQSIYGYSDSGQVNEASWIRASSLASLRSLNIGVVHLTALKFGQEGSETWPHYLLRMCEGGELRSLGVKCDMNDRHDREKLHEFLTTKARNLEHLRIDYAGGVVHFSGPHAALVRDETGQDGFGGIPAIWPSIDLSKTCPSLLTLTLILTLDYTSPHHPTDSVLIWRHALRLIATAPRASLRLLTIGVPENPFENVQYQVAAARGTPMVTTLQRVDWGKWEEVLMGVLDFGEGEGDGDGVVGVEIGELRSFDERKVYGPGQRTIWSGELETFVREKLSGLDKRGLVRVFHVDRPGSGL
ncbi:hypothetical protein BXZ70DRAFT_1009017 [Cristinia sonorae]|uniref:Uncharacterized protein n=1 Tax=Cristinia sonorae TaxID=1940300 RepID=A0A8K0XP25_9AGAR|nr:hypothetical protein BXZ70DRAFT_1009017 [Cristinia sonorae]